MADEKKPYIANSRIKLGDKTIEPETPFDCEPKVFAELEGAGSARKRGAPAPGTKEAASAEAEDKLAAVVAELAEANKLNDEQQKKIDELTKEVEKLKAKK